MSDPRLSRIEEIEKRVVNQVLEEIEVHFLDKQHTQYRHELSKKFWSKLKKRYKLKGGENNG